MGRRRSNRRQTLSRANSELTLTEGDASSDSESNTSVAVRDTHITNSPTIPEHPQAAHSSRLSTANRFTPIEENDVVVSQASEGSNLAPNRLILPPPTNRMPASDFTLANSGFGDEELSASRYNATQANSKLHTFLEQANQQNESNTRAIKECMSGTANMIRDTCESMKACMTGIASMTQDNFHELLHEIKTIKDGFPRSQSSNLPTSLRQSDTTLSYPAQLGISRPVITSCISPKPSEVTSLASLQTSTFVTQSRMPSSTYFQVSSHSSTFPTTSQSVSTPRSNTAVISEPQNNCNNSQSSLLTTIGLNQTSSVKSQTVRLPPFTGNSNDSWKVWHARFTTVANLNGWDETTRLSELMQRMQGTAAEFVFDEIPTDILTCYTSLVNELDSRFKSVETNRTYRVQFSKRLQKYEESVEEYAAELKRIYDKAYPGRNPEMRRQLLLQQFLNGLRNKDAKFAVEYYKEPNSIEEAVHHVVTYIEAQQGQKSQNWHNRSTYRTVQFENEDGDDDIFDNDDFERKTADRARSISPSTKQILRKVNETSHTNSADQNPAPESSEEMLQKILFLVESSNKSQNVGQGHQDQKGKGQTNGPLTSHHSQYRNSQGHSQNLAPAVAAANCTPRGRPGNLQGQVQGQGQQIKGQDRHATFQCFYCSEIGHIKRNCPVLKAEQTQNLPESNNRNSRPAPLTPYYGHPHGNANYLDLN